MADIEHNDNESIEAEKTVTEVIVAKPKRVRTEAQKAAFEKCRVARADQIKRIKDSGGTQPAKVKRDDVYKLQKNILEKQEEFMNTVVEKVKEPPKKRGRKKAVVVEEVVTETESEPEPPPPKPKRKYTKREKAPEPEPETESDSEITEGNTDSEPEPLPQVKKRQYKKKGQHPETPVIMPVMRQPSLDFR